jgi:mRNA-degrading endonuclease RelE of RelBE toxin-antitoxin system
MQVELTPQAAKELDSVPLAVHGRVFDIMERLTRWPAVSGSKPLRYELKGSFRIRTGAYRVVFRVQGQHVIIWKIDNRRDVYG